MMRVCLTTLGLLVALWVPAIALVDAQGAPARRVPFQISHGPGAHFGPQVAVQPDGRVVVVWIERTAEDSSSRLIAALSPGWTPVVVADLAEAEVNSPRLFVDRSTHLAWLEPGEPYTSLFQAELGAAPSEPLGLALPSLSTLTYDHKGQLFAAWFDGDALNTLDVTRALTTTLPITSPAQGLTLAMDGQSAAHLAWVAQDSDNLAGPLYYASPDIEAKPVLVTDSGSAPHLRSGPSDLAHMCWRQEGGLYYARSDGWSTPQLITANLPEGEAPYALSIGPDEVAHLTWYADGSLWYANSADWEITRTKLAEAEAVSTLDLALDGQGWPQVVWAASDADGLRQIYRLSLQDEHPQMQVISPREGDVLAEDGWAAVESNLLPGDLGQITFYAEVDEPGLGSQGNILLEIGSDGDGSDGWSVPLALTHFERYRRYRVLAIGTRQDGTVLHARGGWFTVQAGSLPWVWLQAPPVDVIQGMSAIGVMAASPTSKPKRVDLFLSPEDPPHGQMEGLDPSRDARYIGSFNLSGQAQWPAPEWQWLPFDSSTIPDGTYSALALTTDAQGRQGYGLLGSLQVQNNLMPQIEIVQPAAGAVVANRLTLAAQVNYPDGLVTRMDFYIERPRPLLALQSQRYQVETSLPDLIWIGSDSDGTDGWSVERMVNEALDGDAWHARVVAFGHEGPLTQRRSEELFTILGRRRPFVRIASPATGSEVSGTHQVQLDVLANEARFTGADIYLEDAGGLLTLLGEARSAEDMWTLAWDTRLVGDGLYALVAVIRDDQGRTTMARAESLRVRNQTVALAFMPDDEASQLPETLSGTATLRVVSTALGAPAQRVDIYYQDDRVALHSIGQAAFRDQPVLGWWAVWNTRAVLDGRYLLVAIASYADGSTSRVEWDVAIQNAGPTITLREPQPGAAWSGPRRISWATAHPLQLEVSVTIAYSPDGGEHWTEIASGLEADGSYVWDTTRHPDGADARLRLTASDGLYSSQATSAPFTVSNRNAPPRVSLLAPQADTTHQQEMLITWQAWDPEGSALSVDLDYRAPGEDWQSIAQDLPNVGYHLWPLQDLTPHDQYSLRVTVHDAAGLLSTAEVKDLTITDTQPPTVRLLAPSSLARLRREAVILWQATDPDGDTLLIDLYYSDDAGQTWIPLAEGLPNTGYYTWQVSFLPAGSQYRIRIVARDDQLQSSHESPWLFAIGDGAPPQVTLSAPAGGSTLGGTRWVRWFAADPDGMPVTTTLSLRPTGTSEWYPLAQNLHNQGFYLWDTTQHADGAYDLRITVSDGKYTASAALAQPVVLANSSNQAPQVTIISPRGGARWGGVQEILWQAWDENRDAITATLYLSTDGGSWQELAQVEGYNGRYLWDTRTAPMGDTFRLRIVVHDGLSRGVESTPGAFYLDNERSRPPTVVVTYPGLSGELLRGDTLAWIAESPVGAPLSVSIALSTDNGRTWRSIAEGLANTGEYTLSPALLESGIAHRVRLRVSDTRYIVQAFSPDFLPTEPRYLAPELALQTPRGGETWSGTRSITWVASDPADQALRIIAERSADDGRTWKRIGASPENSGSVAWNTLDEANGVYLVRITADNGQASSIRVSPPVVINNPERSAPVISVLFPRGGQIWSGTQEVRWRASGTSGSTLRVDLAYSLDGGATWGVIERGVPDTGSYIWDTTALPNCDRVWLRAAVSDGRLTTTDVSDGSFAVRNVLAPVITLLSPRDGEHWVGRQTIAWHATAGTLRPVQVTLETSTDGGLSWRLLAAGLGASGSYVADAGAYAANSELVIRATASDGSRSGIDFTNDPVVIQKQPSDMSWYLSLP
ncbi:MAG: hypothetical protein ACYC5M_06700 [Anaerolineae bacterium]